MPSVRCLPEKVRPWRGGADSIDGITKFLNGIDDALSSVIEQDEEPTLERLLGTVRADVEKIMAEP